MDNNIDPNKIIRLLNDCQGTCKTPIGCTCKVTQEDEEAILAEEKSAPQVVIQAETTVIEIAENQIKIQKSVQKACSCGKSTSGDCNCNDQNTENKCGCSGRTSGCCSGKKKLEVYNWLEDVPGIIEETQMVEVQFKNTRKGYFQNSNKLEIYKGDIVAVEATPGHDIGEVTLTGKLVLLQMKKNNFRGEVKRVYRHAKASDIEKSEAVKAKEHKTMLRAREIAEDLQLDMKISDVEFQGDGNKAIFYYIADGRVDFRQLIKVYASEFRVKIEMKQIGARQEAGRVGGIGPCGRELCCSSAMSNFVSVSTSAARLQDISLNPQKLAGQCGKLKCCINFEVDTYVEAQNQLPSPNIILDTKDTSYYLFKTDILSGTMLYSTDKRIPANLVSLSKERVFEIIDMNRNGKKPLNLQEEQEEVVATKESFDVLSQESITRFDESGAPRNRNNKRRPNNNRNNDGNRNNNTRERGRQNNNQQQAREPKEIRRNNQPNANTNDPKSVNDPQQANNKRRPKRRPNRPNNGNSNEQKNDTPKSND